VRDIGEELDVEAGEVPLRISEGVRLGITHAGHPDGARLDQAVGVAGGGGRRGGRAAAGREGQHRGKRGAEQGGRAEPEGFFHLLIPIGSGMTVGRWDRAMISMNYSLVESGLNI